MFYQCYLGESEKSIQSNIKFRTVNIVFDLKHGLQSDSDMRLLKFNFTYNTTFCSRNEHIMHKKKQNWHILELLIT